MKQTRRRLTFQLTPLLDLLLIVIFAQYMEVQQSQAVARDELQATRQQLQAEHAALRDSAQHSLNEQEAALRQKSEALDDQRRSYAEQFESIVDQHQRAGTALAEALNLPGESLEHILRLQASGRAEEAQQLQQAVTNLKQLLETRGSRFIQFLQRVDEMQKHVTVWEIHIQENGKALFTDGEQTATVSFETTAEFTERAFTASKQLPEPRTLVIVLLSHGNAQQGFRRRAVEAMPELMGLLRQDAGSTHWFDFSLMGFQPTGPLFFHPAVIQPADRQ